LIDATLQARKLLLLAEGERESYNMAESILWMVIFTGLAIVIVIAIFVGAFRFVTAARAKSMQLKWQTRPPERSK
jgi:hypothetical protein